MLNEVVRKKKQQKELLSPPAVPLEAYDVHRGYDCCKFIVYLYYNMNQRYRTKMITQFIPSMILFFLYSQCLHLLSCWSAFLFFVLVKRLCAFFSTYSSPLLIIKTYCLYYHH